MSDLIEKLRLACDDPMWADHVEMPKKLLRHAVDYLDALKKQVEELTAERDALEVKAVSLLWAVPGETLCGEVQSLHKRALELQSAEAEAAALRKALEFYADVSKYPAPLTGGMGDLWADCGRIARAALEAAGGRR